MTIGQSLHGIRLRNQYGQYLFLHSAFRSANIYQFDGSAGSVHPGTLFIRTREGTNWATGEPGFVFTIADTGDGIAHENIKRLFEPFFSTKGTTGTGLGLWVSKEIIERHRGAIRLRSSQSAEHHGSVSTIFLPYRAAER